MQHAGLLTYICIFCFCFRFLRTKARLVTPRLLTMLSMYRKCRTCCQNTDTTWEEMRSVAWFTSCLTWTLDPCLSDVSAMWCTFTEQLQCFQHYWSVLRFCITASRGGSWLLRSSLVQLTISVWSTWWTTRSTQGPGALSRSSTGSPWKDDHG